MNQYDIRRRLRLTCKLVDAATETSVWLHYWNLEIAYLNALKEALS